MELRELLKVHGPSIIKKGFCRYLTTINPAKGLIKENGRECQSVLHKGKGVIIVNGATWKTR